MHRHADLTAAHIRVGAAHDGEAIHAGLGKIQGFVGIGCCRSTKNIKNRSLLLVSKSTSASMQTILTFLMWDSPQSAPPIIPRGPQAVLEGPEETEAERRHSVSYSSSETRSAVSTHDVGISISSSLGAEDSAVKHSQQRTGG